MHIVTYLLPRYYKTRSVRTKDRVRGIAQIVLRQILRLFDHFFRIMTGSVPGQFQGDLSHSLRISRQIFCIIADRTDRCRPGQDRRLRTGLRSLHTAVHIFHIGHGTSQTACGQLHPEAVERLQQNALSLHQSLSYRTAGRLPEIAALSMFRMRATGQDTNLHIRDGAAGQHASVYLFLQMRKHQPLPIFIQNIFTAQASEMQTAPPLLRLQQQMDLRIMPQRFEMSDPFHRSSDRLLINYRAFIETDNDPETIRHRSLQHFQLYLTHHADLDLSPAFPSFFIAEDPKLRILFLQNTQFCKQHRIIGTILRKHTIGEHRFQKARGISDQSPQSHTDPCFVQSGHCTDPPCRQFRHSFIFFTGIDADLINFFPNRFCLTSRILQHIPSVQCTTQDLQIGQALPFGIPADLEYPCRKVFPIGGLRSILRQRLQQDIHAFHLQCRSEKDRKQFALLQ